MVQHRDPASELYVRPSYFGKGRARITLPPAVASKPFEPFLTSVAIQSPISPCPVWHPLPIGGLSSRRGLIGFGSRREGS
jgi:hypothetical protein